MEQPSRLDLQLAHRCANLTGRINCHAQGYVDRLGGTGRGSNETPVTNQDKLRRGQCAGVQPDLSATRELISSTACRTFTGSAQVSDHLDIRPSVWIRGDAKQSFCIRKSDGFV